MLEKMKDIIREKEEIEKKIANLSISLNQKEYVSLNKELKDKACILKKYEKFLEINQEIEDLSSMIETEDDNFVEEARLEIQKLRHKLDSIKEEIDDFHIPKDPDDSKNSILEIRAGTGGDEATLFVSDLLKMYSKYLENNKYKLEILSSHPTGVGGFKEVILLVSGNNAYKTLKYESGVHRVQRVPETEAQGRIHTSAVTVAVLPEADEVDVDIDPKDLRIDVFRATGPGGQSVNTTDSAVRITHLPTNMVVSCQDEKSQHKNKAKAMKVLYARLLQQEKDKQEQSIASKRKQMVGSGDRSERIRTYNYPQNRVSDHRINLTLYRLTEILEGDLQDIMNALKSEEKKKLLKEN